MILHEDFLEFLKILNAQHVRYVLIGGYAAIIIGVNRTTGDMDIFVERTEENANKVIDCIHEFGFGFLGFTVKDIMNDLVLQLGVSPVRIDILSALPGIEFVETFDAAFTYSEEGVSFKVIHINHLIKNKTAVGRDKDKHDVKALTKLLNQKRNQEK